MTPKQTPPVWAVELSEEKRMSASKFIPRMKMMHHALQGKATNLNADITQLTEHLTKRV